MQRTTIIFTQWKYWAMIAVALTCGCMKSRTDVAGDHKPSSATALARQHGIEVERISLSAAGYMLDLRYRVVDPVLAAGLMDRGGECCVVDQKSGAKMIVPAPPKVGSLRQRTPTPVEGKTYFVMFANPGRLIQAKDKVTVVIDDLKLTDLVVQ